MEISSKTPDWTLCGFNDNKNKEAIENIIANATIAPKEFWPAGAKSWKGISFKDWMEYISKYKQKTEDKKKEDEETKLIIEIGTDATKQIML
jgi:hypothetical protein